MARWKLHNIDYRHVIGEIMYEADNPVIVTDPPFNVGYGYDKYNDRMEESQYWSMLADLVSMAPACVVHYPEALHRLSIELGKAPDRTVSWVYNSNTKKQHRDAAFYGINPDFDRVKRPYYSMKDKRCRELMEKTGGARSYDWLYCDQVKNISKEKTAHPCQMPLDVMRFLVGIIPAGSTVIDPFAGSGTTGVACVMAGIPFIGCELSPDYFEIATKRLQEAEDDVAQEYRQPKLF